MSIIFVTRELDIWKHAHPNHHLVKVALPIAMEIRMGTKQFDLFKWSQYRKYHPLDD
jgi:hypothetical protein